MLDFETKCELGIKEFAWGLDARETVNRQYYGPTVNICGIVAGYTGNSDKTIIPNEIRVKMDFRCPPNLEPARQVELLKAYSKKQGFNDAEMMVSVRYRSAVKCRRVSRG